MFAATRRAITIALVLDRLDGPPGTRTVLIYNQTEIHCIYYIYLSTLMI